jgi:cytochrome c2
VRTTLFPIVACAIALYGCTYRDRTARAETLTGGDTTAGQKLIYSFACGSCHSIPGIPDADGTVGPPLEGIASRTYIAGVLVNTSQNLFRWIRDPQDLKRGTAMPKLGVSEEQARNMAAYLYTLD